MGVPAGIRTEVQSSGGSLGAALRQSLDRDEERAGWEDCGCMQGTVSAPRMGRWLCKCRELGERLGLCWELTVFDCAHQSSQKTEGDR